MLTLQLYAKTLGIRVPWRVHDIEVDHQDREIRVFVGSRPGADGACPVCGKAACRESTVRQRWRMPDPVHFDTVLVVDVPLVACPVHGPTETPQPWSQPGSGFHPAELH